MENAVAVVKDEQKQPSVVLPLLSAEEMVTAIGAYQRLQNALDKSMPDQIMTIRGKKFRKKGYWRSIRTAFGLSAEAIKEERILIEGGDDWGYVVTYRATSPGGTFADGDGSCMASEKPGANQATEHNVRSHAHTRAFNRAVSNLVGFGEVSAEELPREEFKRTGTPVITGAYLGKSILDHVNQDKVAAQQILQSLIGKTTCSGLSTGEATKAYKLFEEKYLNVVPDPDDDVPFSWDDAKA